MTVAQLIRIIQVRQDERFAAGEKPMEEMFLSSEAYAEVRQDARFQNPGREVPDRCCGVLIREARTELI